ncbi:hypothetical protein HPP92_007929 [Vanilla planifolia]|uniref:Uncharacterized protein n=1 Tax=Vanilla planifolia TaxID=51239 RepID=A0A835RET0_VANPL|nr:hypothetical protein HPP92_007929 [Vanilla planifolia]
MGKKKKEKMELTVDLLKEQKIYDSIQFQQPRRRRAAAADAAGCWAQAAVVRLTVAANERTAKGYRREAAIKIQSIFRSHLVLNPLLCITTFQLRFLIVLPIEHSPGRDRQGEKPYMCVEGISKVASIAAQRIRMVEESQTTPQKQLNYRRSPQQSRFRHSFEMNENMEEFVKIVEMDLSGMRSNSKSRSSYSLTPTERSDLRFCSYNSATHTPRKADIHPQFSPAPSALTELSPRGCSGHFDEFSFATAQSSPHMSAMSNAYT